LIKEAVARRYAKGLFDVACEMNILEEAAQDLDRVAALLEQEPDLKEILEYRRVPTRVKKEIVRGVIGASISSVVFGFMEILIDKHRERSFGAIRESYHDFLRKHKNIVVAVVKTAYPLEYQFEVRLQEVLEKATGKNIELRVDVQPELIGGLVVQIGDRVYDGSIIKQLEMIGSRIMERSSRSLGKLEVEI
jgi:F-type H+-transporting ATPase subunit delta